MKKLTIFLVLLALALTALTGCAGKNETAPITRLEQLGEPGRKIGVGIGTGEDKAIRAAFPDAQIELFNDAFMGYSALVDGKLDAFAYGKLQMELAIRNGQRGVMLLDETVGEGSNVAVGLSPRSPIPDLKGKINAFIAEKQADGTLDDMYNRWVVLNDETMPDIELPKKPEVHLRVGTTGLVPPYNYYVGTELNGYDIELARRFAAWLSADLEFKVYDFVGVIAAAQGGDVDCIMSELFVTPERAEAIPFSDTLFTVELGVMVREHGSPAAGASAVGYTSLSDLNGKRIGVTTGSIQALQVEARLPEAELYYFTTDVDMLSAMRAGKIDAYASAEPLVRYMMAESPDLTYVDEYLQEGMLAAAIFPMTDEGRALCDEFSAFVHTSRSNGVFEEIEEIWFGADESRRVVPDPEDLPAPRGTLRMAVDTSLVPFIYLKDGKPVGIDVDIATRFCAQSGYGLEILPMDFSAIIPSVVTGKVDFSCSGIAYTAERAESVLFSEPTWESRSVVAVLKASGGAKDGGFLSSVLSSFEKTFLREDRWKLFVRGIGTTLLITVLSIVLGTALGFGVYFLCRNGNGVANGLTRFFVWLVHGMPMVVLLMILYYVIFAKAMISGTAVSVIGFTLVFGASVFGMLKSGVGAVDAGQTEAAYTLGYTDHRAFFRVILPQALPHFFPAYKGEITATIKATAIVGYVAVQDLTKMGDIVRSRTYDAFFPLIAVAVIYFILAAILTAIVNRLGVFIDPRRRKPEDILKGVMTE